MLELGRNVNLVDVTGRTSSSICASLAATGTLADCVGFDSTLGTRSNKNALLGWLASIAHLTSVLLHCLCLLISAVRRCLAVLGVTQHEGPVDIAARLVELDGLPRVFGGLRGVGRLHYLSLTVILDCSSLILMNRPFDLVLTEPQR